MSPTSVAVVIAAIGLFMSVVTSVLICGVWAGGVKSELNNIDKRLARIEGAFTLTPAHGNIYPPS